MGQTEVIKVLEKSKEPMSRTQIAEELNEIPTNISKLLNKLLHSKEIQCIELDRHESFKLLKWKIPIRRTRFYYI